MHERFHSCVSTTQYPQRLRWWLVLCISISMIGIIAILSGYVLMGGIGLLAGMLLGLLGLQLFNHRRLGNVSQQCHRVNTQLHELINHINSRSTRPDSPVEEDRTAHYFQIKPLHDVLTDDARKRLCELQQARESRGRRHVQF